MAASFIKKNDGNYYLRLTENTTSVKFAAVSQAGNTYNFYINGTLYISKPYIEDGIAYYTSSASPVPAGGNLDDGRFPGTETAHYFSGSGTRDYYLSFDSSPTPGTFFALGGEALYWGGYAYPGDGYVQNSLAVGIKVPSYTYQNVTVTGALTHVFDDVNNVNTLFNGSGANFQNYNLDSPDGTPCTGSLNYESKYYRVTWNNQLPTNDYSLNITILDNQSSSGAHAGFISLCAIGQKTSQYFDVQFYHNQDPINSISYVRSFSASATYSIAVPTQWSNAYNLFVKQSGVWREISNAYIKQNGVWRKFYQNFGNSSWINMLELADDAIDFGVQVIALN